MPKYIKQKFDVNRKLLSNTKASTLNGKARLDIPALRSIRNDKITYTIALSDSKAYSRKIEHKYFDNLVVSYRPDSTRIEHIFRYTPTKAWLNSDRHMT